MPARYRGRERASELDREMIVLSRSKNAASIGVPILRRASDVNLGRFRSFLDVRRGYRRSFPSVERNALIHASSAFANISCWLSIAFATERPAPLSATVRARS